MKSKREKIKKGDLVRLNAKAQRRLGMKDGGFWRVLDIDEKTGRVTLERLERSLDRARKSTWHKDWLEVVNVYELPIQFRNKIFAEKLTELQKQFSNGEISTKQFTESLNELVVAEQVAEIADQMRKRVFRKLEKESLTEHDIILSYYFEHPEEIEEGLIIPYKEFSLYRARIDLLGFDKNGNVVVIEVISPSDDRIDKVEQVRTYWEYILRVGREIYGLEKPKRKIRFFLVSLGHLDGDVLEIKNPKFFYAPLRN